jgi:hypothetical protein
MRSSHSIVLLALLGCAPERLAPPSDDPGGEPPVAMVAITGTVYDSLTGGPAPNVHVEFGGKVLFTDAAGKFTANTPEGMVRVLVNSPDFETVERWISVPPSQISLPLRRQAPLPTNCRLEDGVFRAVVVDLQGRKSLERWSRSTLTLRLPGEERTIGALAWGYRGLDSYHWELTIADAGPTLERVDWRLFDSDLNLYTGSCIPTRTSGGVQDSIA